MRPRLRAQVLAAGLAAWSAAAGLGVETSARAQDRQTPREEAPEDYPDGPNRTDTFYFCTGCHGFKLVAAQGQSRARWSETLDFMVARHKMIDPPQDLRERLLDYLAAAFPERRTPGGWKNPFQ